MSLCGCSLCQYCTTETQSQQKYPRHSSMDYSFSTPSQPLYSCPLLASYLLINSVQLGQHVFAYLYNVTFMRFLLFFTQSVSFLHKYLRLRGPCQESYYNIARLFHQLGNTVR